MLNAELVVHTPTLRLTLSLNMIKAMTCYISLVVLHGYSYVYRSSTGVSSVTSIFVANLSFK